MDIKSEASLLAAIVKPSVVDGHLPLPNGDDAAVIKINDTLIAITTDTVVENNHFSLKYYSGIQVGIKAVESAVSDLIAVGAIPQGIVIALGMKKSTPESLIKEVYTGIHAACERLKCTLLGGDITTNPAGLELAVTAIGYLKEESDILRRSGAKPGELICVSGALGGSAAGLKAIQAGLTGFEATRLKHLEPKCRIDLLPYLSSKINAAIDISDGLSSEIYHICEMSNCGAIVEAEKIPIDAEVKAIAEILHENPLDYALAGGEDYELLFAIPEENYIPSFGTAIGKFTLEKDVLIKQNSHTKRLWRQGYDHLNS